MKRETLEKALEQISDKHIAEAALPAKRRNHWIGPIAAVLALVILAGAVFHPPMQASKGGAIAPESNGLAPLPYAHLLVAEPVYPEMVAYPDIEEDFATFDDWYRCQQAQYNQPEGYADSAEAFLTQIAEQLLSEDPEKNIACSPVNVYMALAMLAEVTEGETRQEILRTLGVSSLEDLRTQAGHIWNAHYCADNATTLTLANSLWLDTRLSYRNHTAQTLADRYYASVLQGQLGSREANEALRAWINQQTGGLLEQQAAGIELPPQTLFALASTIYYRCRWDAGYQFNEKANTTDTFHGPLQEKTVTFMHKSFENDRYYYGDTFAAFPLRLADDSRMWLILPDEGSSPQAFLESGGLETILKGQAKSMEIKVNLSLPKFDISANLQLEGSMKALGIRRVFGSDADFSGILQEDLTDDRLGCASHATRVTIDEEGIEAAAYTILADAGAAPPRDTAEINLVLDRPFLFVIESRDGLPLFAGIVNDP